MANKEFFEGEKVILTPVANLGKPEYIVKGCLTGTIFASWERLEVNQMHYRAYGIRGDDGTSYEFWRGRIWKLRPEGDTNLLSDKDYTMKRLNPEELGDRFAETLEDELGLVRKLAGESNETRKAETERAAVLATLRNLNAYLEQRIKERTQTPQ